ncbi:MAG: hypothetical protein IH820_06575 [Bacteroidetes bacterium]|nr:hypothetical protein [Bacteroidota bacterium]
MRVIHPNAAGIDIGADFIFIAVEDQAVVSFETFTDALHQALPLGSSHRDRCDGGHGHLLAAFV